MSDTSDTQDTLDHDGDVTPELFEQMLEAELRAMFPELYTDRNDHTEPPSRAG